MKATRWCCFQGARRARSNNCDIPSYLQANHMDMDSGGTSTSGILVNGDSTGISIGIRNGVSVDNKTKYILNGAKGDE